MKEEYEKLLEKYGWIVECYSPFEISTKDGSFARDEAAQYVLEGLKLNDYYEELSEKNFINIKILDTIYFQLYQKVVMVMRYGYQDIHHLMKLKFY